jgi:hypothetical protein
MQRRRDPGGEGERARRLTDPAELERFTAEELFLLLRPLLAKGRLAATRQRLERVRPNLPSVCAELAAEWRRSPLLAGRRVGFADFLAARLCTRLHELDQEQYPELYDGHRRYRPEREPLSLSEAGFGQQAAGDSDALNQAGGARTTNTGAREQSAAATSWYPGLEQAMQAQRLAAASQAHLLGALAHLGRGETRSPYRFQRSLGYSTLEAHNHPATSTYLLALDVIAGAAAVASGR